MFGLDKYVPPTVTFRHPVTGSPMSFSEGVPGAEHKEIYPAARGNLVPHQQAELDRMGDSGELDKLFLMDYILGNGDRHGKNYLFSPKGMHLIDNGLIFDSPGADDHYPQYAENFDKDNPYFHPNTLGWLKSLDTKKLGDSLSKYGVPPSDIAKVLTRLNRAVSVLTPKENPSGPPTRRNLWYR